ncbi:metallophosphoesterase [Dongshaea marina]|uniref:metallophosphoesterase n=1 Tax=Dongshaea marina TaxID=2047966 RepID=UPI000D3E3613|nr:metallophosphoesterase [Dongshaea marina]
MPDYIRLSFMDVIHINNIRRTVRQQGIDEKRFKIKARHKERWYKVTFENGVPISAQRDPNRWGKLTRNNGRTGEALLNLLNNLHRADEIQIPDPIRRQFGNHYILEQLYSTEIIFDSKDKKIPKKLNDSPRVGEIRLAAYGDIHGNFQKALDHFIRLGTIEIGPVQYKRLLQAPSPEIIEQYIAQGIIQINVDPSLTILFLGDILADRNPHDKAKLELISQVRSRGVNLIAIYGNHDNAFRAIHQGGHEPSPEQFHQSIISVQQQARYQTVFNDAYQLFHFDIPSQTFFSHAPITGELFRTLWLLIQNPEDQNCFSQRPDTEETPHSFAEKVDIMNQYLSAVIRGKINTFQRGMILYEVVWVRKENWRDRAPIGNNRLMDIYPNAVTNHITGHDNYQDDNTGGKRLFSLDNDCGKTNEPHAARERIFFIHSVPQEMSSIRGRAALTNIIGQLELEQMFAQDHPSHNVQVNL